MTLRSFRTLGLGVLVAGLSSCKTEDPPAAKPDAVEAAPQAATPEVEAPEVEATKVEAAKVEAPAPSPAPLKAAMTEHFAQAVQIEQAVIDGDLGQAKAHAEWIVGQQLEQGLPEAWGPQLQIMVAAARRVAAAEDLPSAARATGELIAGCGACHQAIGSGPRFPEPSPVVEGETTDARMQRHRWAASRLREGIIGPSASLWAAGAGAISVAPPEPCPIPDAEILAPEVLNLRERIHAIGAQAAETTEHAAQAEVYGELLTTCAGCHVGGC